MLTPTRRRMQENFNLCYPFGHLRSRNILKNYYGELEGNDFSVTKVLFLGCGDLMGTLEASTTEHLKNLHIHLNDMEPSILARNILILKVLSEAKFDPNNQKHLSFLWDVWYNTEWPESTKIRFQDVVKDLLDGFLPENVSVPNHSHLEKLMSVWRGWSSSLSSQFQSKSFIENILKERITFIGEVHSNTFSAEAREIVKRNHIDLFSIALNDIVAKLETSFMVSNSGLHHENGIVKKIRDELMLYLKTGSCRVENDLKLVCVNPTLLDPVTNIWQLHPSLSPFDSYLPMTDEELSLKSAKDRILIHPCQKILKRLVSSYRRRLDSIKVNFHLDDALEYCYKERTMKFDVIHCSTLADYVGLPNLLIASKQILADHPEAVMWTDTELWFDMEGSMEKFIENLLCCPLSMIPTIYGVRPCQHLKLGSSSLKLIGKCRHILWQKAQRAENFNLHPSPVISRCLDRLAEKCFTVKFPPAAPDSLLKTAGLVIWYTPLTFYYIISSMIERIGGDLWLQNVPHFTDVPPALKLAKRTLDAWKSGQPLLKLTAHVEQDLTTKGVYFHNMDSRSGAPSVRLVLYPKEEYFKRCMKLVPTLKSKGLGNMYFESFRDIMSLPDVHIIENFHLEAKKTTTENNATISFLMVPDHGLSKTHKVLLLDIVNDAPSFIFDTVGSMTKEKCRPPFPFKSPRAASSDTGFKGRNVKLDSCIESEDKYFLKFSVVSKKDMSDFFFCGTNPADRPFLSPLFIVRTFRVSTIGLSDPDPLLIEFPHPFLYEDATVIPNCGEKTFKISLLKGLQQPWPCEIQAHPRTRWITNNLRKWTDFSDSCHSMQTHVNSQFALGESALPITPIEKTPLNSIRETIKKLLLNRNCTMLQIQHQPEDLFRVKVHQPVVISPNGGPMLIVSVYDIRMMQYLEKEKKLNEKLEEKRCLTLMRDGLRADVPLESQYMKVDATREEIFLWRYMFHVNSTKMVPTLWQKEKIPMSDSSPWVASFISPLYLDFPLDKTINKEAKSERPLPSIRPSVYEKVRCAACQKIPEKLKRCGRCRVVLYCSVECQRGHWTQHKAACVKK